MAIALRATSTKAAAALTWLFFFSSVHAAHGATIFDSFGPADEIVSGGVNTIVCCVFQSAFTFSPTSSGIVDFVELSVATSDEDSGIFENSSFVLIIASSDTVLIHTVVNVTEDFPPPQGHPMPPLVSVDVPNTVEI